MFKNYFKVGIRNLWKNKSFSAINILGLSIGMASAMLILLWIRNEYSYDRFHKNGPELYQAWNRSTFDGKLHCWPTTPKILGPTLKAEYPDVQEFARINNAGGFLATVGDKKIKINGYFTDPGFLTMFSFPLLRGNTASALNGTYSIVLTEKTARKFFDKDNAIGKVMQVNNGTSPYNVTVTGIMKDLPNNTAMDFEFLLPWEYMKMLGWHDDYWGNNSISTYIQLKPAAAIAQVSEKIKKVTITHSKGEEDNQVFLHPLSSLRLYSDFENGVNVGGRISLVRLFAIIAAFILLIACINFMNLSTARSEKRAREVGIRKVVGAQKGALIGQFLGESVIISFIAAVVALLVVEISLPAFNKLTDKTLTVPYNNISFWLVAIGFVLFTGILAGSYPAIYLSSFRPIRVLKGSIANAQALITPRKVLVVTQFTFAIVLIICTIIVRQQIKHAQDRDTGYAKNNLGYIWLNNDIEKNYASIKHELINSGAAVASSKTSAPLTEGWSNSWGFDWQGKAPGTKTVFERFCTDGNLVKTAGFTLAQGRDINLAVFPGDSLACMLNELAVKMMGFKEPLGQVIRDNDRNWTVVGVVKDFILRSPYAPVNPMVIEGPAAWFNVLHIQLNAANTTAANLQKIEQIIKKYNPEFPFEYHFIDQEYARKFNDEQRIGTLAGLFAVLTIFISCLGLFGLATYMAENRIKEIGVRKVLGASVFSITTLLSKDFLRLVLISLLIATPIAWWAMHSWLQDFNYRVNIEWWVFVLAGLLSVVIALGTISYKAIRAAMANPVRSLRSE